MNDAAESRNMRLIGHHDLHGFGNGGEGMALQKTRDGRRIFYIAHESAPKNFTAVDVTDPREPSVVAQTDLAHEQMRSNSLDVVGDILAVAYQTTKPGLQPAGMELFDISDPANPRSISFLDRSGPYSRGAHCLWFVDGEYIHMSSGAADWTPRRTMRGETPTQDDQFYQIIDVRNPSRPEEVGRWWLPGTRDGDAGPMPLARNEGIDRGFRTHNINVYPERPDRAYVAYIGGGFAIVDISDKAHPKTVSHLNCSPPMTGFTHTVLPLFSRNLIIATDEAMPNHQWPKLTWVIDIQDETNPVIIGSLPLPPKEDFFARDGRFGSHNIHENHPLPTAFRSDNLVFGAYFNGGVRVHDITDPYAPQEAGYFIPPGPAGSRFTSSQMNDVYVDEDRLIYAIERMSGGLYIMELND